MPVRGATVEEEREIRDALGELERTLALPVCIDHVAVGHPVSGVGVYNSITRGVTLLRPPSTAYLRSVVRHEVCHGVDLQNDLVDGREDAFPYPDEDGWREGRLPREAFADTCELDLVDLQRARASRCPDDPDLRAAGIVAEEVYGLVEFPTVGARFSPSGAVIVPPGTLAVDPELIPHHGRWVGDVAYVADQLLILSTIELPTGPVVRFSSGTPAASWAPVEGPCPNETTRMFVTGDRIGSAQIDGDVLSWGSWSFAAE